MNPSADAPFARFAGQYLSARPVSDLLVSRTVLSTGPWRRYVVQCQALKWVWVALRSVAGTAHHSGRWPDHLGTERLTDHCRAAFSRQEIDQQFFEFAELALRSRLVLLLDNQMA